MATTSKAVVGNIEIDIAPLVVVSLKCLFEKDEDELLKLYKAAESPGFFYLDVRDSEQYVADIQRMYAITERYFSEPEVVKMRDFVKDDEFRGYKTGKNWSSFEVLQDDFANNGVLLPEVLQPDAITIQRFVLYCHHIVNTMITHLSESLWPNSNISLEVKHRPTETSNSSLKVYRAPTLDNLVDVGDSTHTDGGTLTLLYCDKWATQIQLPWNKQWAWVEPKPGHAIVTVGDTLHALSGGRVHSCQHRVSQPVDGYEERWAVSYFFRPEHGASLAAL